MQFPLGERDPWTQGVWGCICELLEAVGFLTQPGALGRLPAFSGTSGAGLEQGHHTGSVPHGWRITILDSRLWANIPSPPTPQPSSIEKQVEDNTPGGVTSLLSSPSPIPFISASFPFFFGGESLSDSLPVCPIFLFPRFCFCLSCAPLSHHLPPHSLSLSLPLHPRASPSPNPFAMS